MRGRSAPARLRVVSLQTRLRASRPYLFVLLIQRRQARNYFANDRVLLDNEQIRWTTPELYSICFTGGLTGPGSLTHAPDVPLKIWQMHTPLQGFVALHVPVQAGTRLGFLCNWRAETVPAQRTAVTIAASKVLLMVLLLRMLLLLFCSIQKQG
jgi:hypothetical protein